MERRWSVAIAGVAVLVVLSGCLSGNGVGQPDSLTPTAAQTPTASPTVSQTGCPSGVSFYGLGSPGETAWEPDRIAIGYTVPANASVFFVAFEEGTVIGTTHVTTTDREHGVTADGDGIPLENALTGSHMIRVGAYRDSNANGQFDFGTDSPCRSDGNVVEAGPRRINFSTLQYRPSSTPGTPTPESSTPTKTPWSHEQAMEQPDPDKTVQLANEWNQSVTMHVRVIREATNTTVHNETYDLTAGTEREIYTTAAANPEGIEAFTVVLTAQNTTQRVTIKTNACYGDAYGTIREDGTVYLFHAIC